MEEQPLGSLVWTDLTVPDAESTRTFYEKMLGWTFKPVSMGDYEDFTMFPADSEVPAGGICHSRGVNAEMPGQWINYFTVQDIDQSVKDCIDGGGELITPVKNMGDTGKYCVVKDPAGACVGLYQYIQQSEK